MCRLFRSPLVDWEYTRRFFHINEEQKAQEAADKAASEARKQALADFVESIPDNAFTDEIIVDFLDESNSGRGSRMPSPIIERTVSVIKHLPARRACVLVPHLHESEVPGVIKHWDYKDAKPFVQPMIKAAINGYRYVFTSIENWPQEEQELIIKELIENRWDNIYIKSDLMFALMRDWPVEKSRPYVEAALKYSKDGYMPDRRYYDTAEAISDWPESEIDSLFADEDNLTSWAGSESKERDKAINKMQLSILRNRTAPISEKMIQWVRDGLDWNFQSVNLATSIVKKRPQLFDYVASNLFLSPKDTASIFAAKHLETLSKEEQYRYFEAISDGFSRYWQYGEGEFINEGRSSRKPIPGLDNLLNMVSQWDSENRESLIVNLLQRQKSVDKRGSSRYDWKNAFRLLIREDTITNPQIVKQLIVHSISRADTILARTADDILEKIERNEETEALLREAAGQAISLKLSSPNKRAIDETIEIAEKYDITSIDDYYDFLPHYAQNLFDSWNLSGLEDLSGFFKKNPDYVSFLSKNPDQACTLTREKWSNMVEKRVPFRLLEAEIALSAGVDLEGIENENDYKKLFESLIKIEPTWQNEQNIANPFRRGAELFGYKRMFKYINRKGLTRHDALHAFENIIIMYEASRLSPNTFYGQIMTQVRSDGSMYDTGTAHHELNSIAQTLNTDFERAKEIAAVYPQDKELQELAKLLSNPQEVFASWNRLKFASSRMRLLERTELLEQLQELRGASEKQYTYFKTLLMHPASKVDAQAVLEFWQNPESFLARLASHTPDEIQDRKKPSNYIHIPNLDLTASQMRDSLIEGDLDRIQAFSPMEIRYHIPVVNGQPITSLVDLTSKALGSKRNNIKGLARNTRKLFSKIKEIIQADGVAITDFLQGNTDGLSASSADAIRRAVLDKNFGMSVDWQKITAQIHRKSDPVGVLAGNDTANCMPFGDGKTTVYTFNPITAQFTMQVYRDDGNRRTVAQSVMTKDKDVHKRVPILYERLTQENSHLIDFMPQTVLVDAPAYAAADNVEVSPNWQGNYEQVIEAIYRDFYREYMARFGQAQGFNTNKIIIGQGYSDAMTHLPSEQNTFVPLAPVSYSDKIDDEVFVLDLEKNTLPAFSRKVITPERQEMEILGERPQGNEVSFFTYEDTLQSGYIEGKAYSDNPDMIEHLHNMENALIGMHINNASKRLPHMSLKYTDPDGQMRGYMLAYEGRFEEDSYDDRWKDKGERVVYIADLASDKEHKMTGGRLINSFIDLYQKNYLKKDDLVPLYMEARESTSYRIIQRQLDRIGDKLGIEFELEELPTYPIGDDTMHPIIIRPVKNNISNT